jgi:purine nucleoside permease
MLRLVLLIAALLSPAAALAEGRIPIKVVVLTTFERGADTGDIPGEFQFWVERYPFTEQIEVPGLYRPARYSPRDGVLAIMTGMRARPREALAALILDPRFDFSRTYWLVAGIAGVDPRAGSIGSAAWANWVVDADPAFEIDDREIAKDWPWGIWSPGADRPGIKGQAIGSSGMVWRLDPDLTQWAYGLTRGVALADNAQLRTARARYASEPAALKPPHVFVGDVLGTTRFWHGELRTRWARDWVRMWTDGRGVFAMTDCEDQGIMEVLDLHAKAGRIDVRRVLVLRTASNYSRQADGEPAQLKFTDGGAVAGFEAAYRVGSPVVRALVEGWPRYADAIPQAAP